LAFLDPVISTIGFWRFIILIIFTLTYLSGYVFRPKGFGRPDTINAQLLYFYKWHIFLFIGLYFQRNFIDSLNDPIRGATGLDFTYQIHRIEGDLVFYIQSTFDNEYLTMVMAPLYLIGYTFIMYFSFIFFIFMDDRKMANRVLFCFTLTYLISVPFYLFFPVDIPSQYIPGMKSLLYDWSSVFHGFFVGVDPFDNDIPSLHIAVPFALAMIIHRTSQERGVFLYKRYTYFLYGMMLIFTFAIIYLGVHWIIDIFFGLLVGWFAVIATEIAADDFWEKLYAYDERFFSGLERKFSKKR